MMHGSRDELIAASREQTEIDAAFSAMANDAAYQVEALAIAAEFNEADWEAFQAGEGADASTFLHRGSNDI